jgi:hypothetical protein
MSVSAYLLYGFSTREREPKDLNSKILEQQKFGIGEKEWLRKN